MKTLSIIMAFIAFCGMSAAAEEITIINPDAAFPEGPVWHENMLYYVEYGAHTVLTWNGEEHQQFWRHEGCGPSAVVVLPSGEFLVTCYDSGGLAHLSSTGELLTMHEADQDGQAFVGPNDAVVDARGGAYFTASGPWESEPIVGKIFYRDAEGVITEVADDLHYANGLALSPDGATLYCAESEAQRVIQFHVNDDATLSDRRLFVRVSSVDPESGCLAYPDGIKMDSQGNLYIGQFSSGRIVAVTPEKELLHVLEVPSPSAPNLAFDAEEENIFVMAVDDGSNPPYPGKVYKIPKP